MNKKYILFDLDGTLTDPMEGITKSVRHALAFYGIKISSLQELCPFIGPPLKDSFMEYYGFSSEQAVEAIDKFREYFAEKGIFENKEYPGIKEMLERLRGQGKVLLVATSKPEIFARRILEYFDLTQYFRFIGGANLDETRVKKGEVIRYVLETAGITDIKETVMVGDRQHDVIGAVEAGMECIGVLYGYGDREELERAGAIQIAATVEELSELLSNYT